MEPLLLLAVALPLAGVVALLARFGRQDRRIVEGWLHAARHAGLTALETRPVFWGVATLSGLSGDLRVRFEWREPAAGGSSTVIRVDGPSIVPLSLQREGLGAYVENRFAPRELVLGDEPFDELFYVRGPYVMVRAVLDHDTRRHLTNLLHEADLEIVNGELGGRVPQSRGQPQPDPRVSRVLSELLVAARRLARPTDARRRLADNARVDPQPGVRLQSLLALVHECPDDPTTRVALHRACADRSDEIRVRAAALLGEDGRETLVDIACARHPHDEWAARAIGQLGEHFPPKVAKDVLGRALHARHPQTARACLTALGQMSWPEGVALLASVMNREQGGELAIVAARALGQTGLPSAERPLLEALTDGAPDLRVVVAEALGRVGTAGAIPLLKQAEARHGNEAAFRRAARQAIAEIQARIGAAPGQLSFTPSTEGTLSLADDERGRLSIDPPQRR